MIINLLHLLNNIIRNANLSKQDIHLSRHATSNRMNRKSHLSTMLSE